MDDTTRPKQAACLVCRRSKIRCDWSYGPKCRRCTQLNVECIRPTLQAGRQKGIKNKRKGLDKALYQIEQALKKAKTGQESDAESKALHNLQQLLGGHSVPSEPKDRGDTGRQLRLTEDQDMSSSAYGDADGPDDSPGSHTYLTQHREGSLTIDDAENPLQLLARASNLQLSPGALSGSSPGELVRTHKRRQTRTTDDVNGDIQSYFTSIRVNLDIGDDIDPLSMGLVTEAEAEDLFSYFHKHLAHTRWGLDPEIFTLAFTRSRSAFLCTAIMAGSALFRPQDGALSKRLSTHAKTLAQRVMTRRHKSVEIILAFMLLVPWMHPGEHSTDDETCCYVAMATTIAIDLSVHKLLMGTDTLGSAAAVARGDCVDPRTALAIDGLGHVDPASTIGRRLLRRRERCWIALFVLERGMSLARGRSFTVPMTRSLRDCDKWHISDIADPQDEHLVSMAVLRRDLDGVFATIRAMCDGSQNHYANGSAVANSIQATIERVFEQWHKDWGTFIRSGPDHKLPPYVDILVTHTRLSIYSGVINHPTAPAEARQFFRTAGMSSALTVLRVAIQGEARLRSMPNNTAIMITFAACFALTLSAYASGDSSLAPSVRTLIEETADVLERVGTVTPHRNGLSSLYGRYLRATVKKAASIAGNQPPRAGGTRPMHAATPASTLQSAGPRYHRTNHDHPSIASRHAGPSQASSTPHSGGGFEDPHGVWPTPNALQFSAMSDQQIVDYLNQPDNAFAPAGASLSWEDMHNFEGVNWPNMPGFAFG